jgi:bifunctional non-homologous end joining protein LigD
MQAVKAHGLEGVIAKRLDSKYHLDRRGADWLKLPLKPSQHFVIGAYRLDGKRLELLLVGQFELPDGQAPASPKSAGKLLFAGKVHQGLNPANRHALLKLLQPLATKQCPFANLPTAKSGHWAEGVTADEMSDYTWLRPEIEAEIKLAEWPQGTLSL